MSAVDIRDANVAEARRQHAELLSYGYRDIDEIKGITVGSRVHHIGQRFPEAWQNGTATVLVITEKVPSSWADKYGRRDIELIIQRDKPLLEGMSPVSQWADYHTCRIEPLP